jgi:hypothetical protein
MVRERQPVELEAFRLYRPVDQRLRPVIIAASEGELHQRVPFYDIGLKIPVFSLVKKA